MIVDFRPVLTALMLSAAATLPATAETTTPAATTEATAETQAEAETPVAEVETLDDIYMGEAEAPLTIYEYASFTCSHCATFHEEVFPKLKAEYIDTGKVRFAQRDVYFDQVGLWASVLAHCGGDDKYFPIADMLMAEQKDWLSAKSGDNMVASLRKIGAKAGLTAEQMDSCWADEPKVQQLVATFQKNAAEDGINATPTFMIGGEKVPNQDWSDMKEQIDAKLAAAEAADKPAN